jgi:hypothetical protein
MAIFKRAGWAIGLGPLISMERLQVYIFITMIMGFSQYPKNFTILSRFVREERSATSNRNVPYASLSTTIM